MPASWVRMRWEEFIIKKSELKLDRDFYRDSDVLSIARRLIGKMIYTRFSPGLTGGIITETEAYAGINDKASHAYGGRRTPRTETMYADGGVSYVYLCYGIHSLFNVVTGIRDEPHAVLIRAIFPHTGIKWMEQRRGLSHISRSFCSGPGNLSKALGIHYSHSGISLLGNKIWLSDEEVNIPDSKIKCSSRIGVHYAGEDASLPYRFFIDPDMFK